MRHMSPILQQLLALAQKENPSLLDIDLMMGKMQHAYDLLYAERNNVLAQIQATAQQRPAEPTLNEVVASISVADREEESEEAIPVTQATEAPETAPDEPPLPVGTTILMYEEVRADELPDQTPTAPEQKTPSPHNVRHYISINDKYYFISELFRNNKDAYEEALDEINISENFEDAHAWLKASLYEQYGWEEESGVVQLFLDAVMQYFQASGY
jgi:cell pole-organizing protein PopZ